jgi:hypothetical protein
MPLPGTLPASIPAAILETVLTGLAALFLAGAGGDMAAARHAASCMLAAYHPESEAELCLAANIVGFSFHAIEALGQAAAPDIPLTRILRLRSSAVSLSRESAKAERRLAQLRNARQHPAAAVETQPAPAAEQALAPIQDNGKIAAAAKAGGVSWTRAFEDRQRDIRIAASVKRAEARFAAPPSPAIQGAVPRTMAEAS